MGPACDVFAGRLGPGLVQVRPGADRADHVAELLLDPQCVPADVEAGGVAGELGLAGLRHVTDGPAEVVRRVGDLVSRRARQQLQRPELGERAVVDEDDTGGERSERAGVRLCLLQQV